MPGEKLAEDACKNLPQHTAAQPEYLCIAVLHGECCPRMPRTGPSAAGTAMPRVNPASRERRLMGSRHGERPESPHARAKSRLIWSAAR